MPAISPIDGDLVWTVRDHADFTYFTTDDGETWIHERLLEPDTTHTYCYVSTTFVEDVMHLSYYVGRPDAPLEALRLARVPVPWLYE